MIKSRDYFTARIFLRLEYRQIYTWSALKQFHSTGHIADITILPDNNIALLANLNYSNGQGNTYSMFKMSSTGQPGWSGTYSPNSAHDYGTTIEHDTAGIIYITGGVLNFDNGSYDFTALNIHPNGSNDWIARFNHLTRLKDMAYDLVVEIKKPVTENLIISITGLFTVII